jgi:hypothetical protein
MDALRSTVLRISLCLSTGLLAACGGGGGSGASSMLPAMPGTTPPPSGTAPAPQSVAFNIAIPSATASSNRRRIAYVSAGTKSASITYSLGTQTVNCAQTCAATLQVLPGTQTFAVSLYSGANGAGSVLSTGRTTATIVAGQANTVQIVFGGVVARLALSLGSASVTAGSAATIPVSVQAIDAAGYTIVGPDPYAQPIALSDDDTSGVTTLSTTTVTSPQTTVALTYSGAASIAAAHLSASVPGTTITAPSATLAVQVPPPPPTPPPSGVPKHVATWYYFGLVGVNASVPVDYMVAHADYAEDGGSADYTRAFKSAGGKYAVAYTDPAYVAYCVAPFTPPAGRCDGPIGAGVSSDESAWFHGADGSRVRHYDSPDSHYQEALNPGSPSARNAYKAFIDDALSRTPALDYIMADDSGGVFTGSDGSQLSGWMYGFNAPEVEITTDAAFIAAERQMLAVPSRPVLVNGYDPSTHKPSYNGAWLDSPNVAGNIYEGCYGGGNGLDSNQYGVWTDKSNGLLAVIAHRSLAVCMMVAPATPSNRIYEMASWWMTYTEPYSVAAPLNGPPDGSTILPEYDLVPRQPRTTATSDVNALRAATGAFVREFDSCYQAGVAIGPCAAVVNPNPSASVSMPALSGHYTSVLAVDDKSAFAGGKATWSGSVPSQLGALSAVVLR